MDNINRINISSNSPWEDIVGYSRAVKIGPNVFISGTTAIDNNGNIVGKDDPYAQTIQCIKNIENALFKANASLKEITRIRVYTVDINYWEKIGEALSRFFKEIKPAATMIEISKLIDPELLVEIEADAYIL